MGGYVQDDPDRNHILTELRKQSRLRDAILSRAVAPILDRMPPIRLRGFLRQSVSYPALARGLRP